MSAVRIIRRVKTSYSTCQILTFCFCQGKTINTLCLSPSFIEQSFQHHAPRRPTYTTAAGLHVNAHQLTCTDLNVLYFMQTIFLCKTNTFKSHKRGTLRSDTIYTSLSHSSPDGVKCLSCVHTLSLLRDWNVIQQDDWTARGPLGGKRCGERIGWWN